MVRGETAACLRGHEVTLQQLNQINALTSQLVHDIRVEKLLSTAECYELRATHDPNRACPPINPYVAFNSPVLRTKLLEIVNEQIDLNLQKLQSLLDEEVTRDEILEHYKGSCLP